MSRIALGIDPGAHGNNGWALVTDADEDGPRRIWRGRAGVVEANGDAIAAVVRSQLPSGLALVAVERPLGHFHSAANALNRVIGRWLGALEQWTWGPSGAAPVPIVEVRALDWQAEYVGKWTMPRWVQDAETGQQRDLFDAEKKAARASYQDAYRLHAVRQLGLDPALPADAAAAAWVACYALDHMPEPPAPKRKRR